MSVGEALPGHAIDDGFGALDIAVSKRDAVVLPEVKFRELV